MSIFKKIKSTSKNGTLSYFAGKDNYENENPDVEALAKKRLKDCDCLVKEPIDFLRRKDERIPELNEKMCEECGCTAPYLFRQSIKKCKNWKE